jgi:hypothetical protein
VDGPDAPLVPIAGAPSLTWVALPGRERDADCGRLPDDGRARPPWSGEDMMLLRRGRQRIYKRVLDGTRARLQNAQRGKF